MREYFCVTMGLQGYFVRIRVYQCLFKNHGPLKMERTKTTFRGFVFHSLCVYLWIKSAGIFIFFDNIHTFISYSYNTFIHRHSLGPLSISSLLESLVGRPSLWCRAENRTRACLTASRRATNWATQHHVSHAAPCEPRRTIWATPHHVSHAAPYEPRGAI